MNLLGRHKIYTDVEKIDKNNVVEVLQKSYSKHRQNVIEIQYLIDYERGEQPLQREKTVRSDIDIRVNSSLPNYIKKFKKGYNWGSPILLVQRGNKEIHNTDSDIDDSGISGLNEILKNGESIAFKDQQMAEFIEICGIGHRMVMPKEFPITIKEIPESLVDIYTLDSRYAFMVYQNGPGQKEMMGVSYVKRSGKNYFTCFTDTERFEIESGEIKSHTVNILGEIPIVEYERSVDRTGCFERKIKEIDALNILESDFANDVSQRTQELWWGDNIDFKEDEKGNPLKPKSGDWILTYSSDGKVAKIAPLSSSFNASSTLDAIKNQRATILQDCYVPIQYENSGGGSTGTATDMASGWSATELDALQEQQMTEKGKILQDCYVPIQYENSGGGSTGTATDMASGWSATELDALQEQQMTEKGKRKELSLILKAIKTVPSRVLPEDSPIRKVHSSDCDFHFSRRRNYDLINKANFLVQLANIGVSGQHLFKQSEIFPDPVQAWMDSKDMFEAIQKSKISDTSSSDTRISADGSDQTPNSPILDGMNTSSSKTVI